MNPNLFDYYLKEDFTGEGRGLDPLDWCFLALSKEDFPLDGPREGFNFPPVFVWPYGSICEWKHAEKKDEMTAAFWSGIYAHFGNYLPLPDLASAVASLPNDGDSLDHDRSFHGVVETVVFSLLVWGMKISQT